MNISEYRLTAWRKLTGKWNDMAIAQLICFAASAILLPTGIGALIIAGPFSLGMSIMALSLARNMPIKLRMIFGGFRRSLGNSIIMHLIVWVYTALWSLLLIIPGLVKHYSYAMSPFILADQPALDPTSVIKKSEKMMNGHKWRLFCLDVTYIGWALLNAFTFGLASFWVIPYHRTAWAEFYQDLKNRMSEDGYYYEQNQ